MGGMGTNRTQQAGKKILPENVTSAGEADLYDPSIVRTIFLNFESKDWERELSDFHNTDVEVPAIMQVDGKDYPDVGVSFRGMSSYDMVPAGFKRSFNVSIDAFNDQQKLGGYKTLNLLNCNGDTSFLRGFVYSQIATEMIPVPRVNFVRVVVNHEDWGVFANVEQFNKDYIKRHFESSNGYRWKVPGSPMGRGGLEYLGDDTNAYKRIYEIKSKDTPEAWERLISLCRILNETPAEQLVEKLEPVLDIDETLKFLALDVALCNSDGYWTRASDYSLYCTPEGKFTLVPHDFNEIFQSGGPGGPPGGGPPGGFGPPPFGFPPFGPPSEVQPPFGPPGGAPNGFGPPPNGNSTPPEGRVAGNPNGPPQGPGGGQNPRGGPRRGPGGGGPGGGGPGHGGPTLDPLVGLNDSTKPLRSKLLAVPELKARYLKYVGQIADQYLAAEFLKPRMQQEFELISPLVAQDQKKLFTTADFVRESKFIVVQNSSENARSTLWDQMQKRREFLLKHAEVRAALGKQEAEGRTSAIKNQRHQNRQQAPLSSAR